MASKLGSYNGHKVVNSEFGYEPSGQCDITSTFPRSRPVILMHSLYEGRRCPSLGSSSPGVVSMMPIHEGEIGASRDRGFPGCDGPLNGENTRSRLVSGWSVHLVLEVDVYLGLPVPSKRKPHLAQPFADGT